MRGLNVPNESTSIFFPQVSFHASQESRGFVAGSEGEYQLVGLGTRQDQQDVQSLQLAWPGILAGGQRNAYQHIQSNYQNTDQFSLCLFKVLMKTKVESTWPIYLHQGIKFDHASPIPAYLFSLWWNFPLPFWWIMAGCYAVYFWHSWYTPMALGMDRSVQVFVVATIKQ